MRSTRPLSFQFFFHFFFFHHHFISSNNPPFFDFPCETRMKFFDPPKIHSFLLLNYRFELGSVRWSRNKGTKGGFLFFLFPFFLLFASRTRYECLETNKNLGKARIGIRDIWRQSRVYDRSRRKTAIASICRGCYGLEKSIGGPIVCVPRSFPRTRLTGGGGRGEGERS